MIYRQCGISIYGISYVSTTFNWDNGTPRLNNYSALFRLISLSNFD